MKNKILCLIGGLTIVFSSFSQFSSLYNFPIPSEGETPIGSLISDGTFLYGMSKTGGTNGAGTIFKIMPDGTNFLKLFDFSGITSGEQPSDALISDGTFLYGMTGYGGTSNAGTIFKILPDGSGFSKLWDFDVSNGAYTQNGSLLFDGTFLYGMTMAGGVNSEGIIFKILPDGTGFFKLWDFGGINGSFPYGSLISDGNFLYGMTTSGGTNGDGTIFKILPNGTSFTKILDFDVLNGAFPRGSLFFDGTFLFGMASQGGINSEGTIFKIFPDGTGFLKILDFELSTSGRYPLCSFISDGTFLYGMTSSGGTTDNGTIFKIMPNGAGYLKLWDFNTSLGDGPEGSLISDGNFLYGTTTHGGASYLGTVFKFGLNIGISETNNETIFKIYPNPTNGLINVSVSSTGNRNVSITNIFGKVVMNETLNFIAEIPQAINIIDIPVGVYFLKIGSHVEKIILD